MTEPTGNPVLRFTVNGPPVPCERARVVQKLLGDQLRSRAVTPPRTRAYEAVVRQVSALAVLQQGARWRLDAEAYLVTLHFFRAAKRGDWDNLAKAVTDAMNGVVYVDDRRIVGATVRLGIDRERPRVEVWVEALGVESDSDLTRSNRSRSVPAVCQASRAANFGNTARTRPSP